MFLYCFERRPFKVGVMFERVNHLYYFNGNLFFFLSCNFSTSRLYICSETFFLQPSKILCFYDYDGMQI